MPDYVELFGGPGGWSEGARELGLEGIGIENDLSACNTRRLAGHLAYYHDVRGCDPLSVLWCNARMLLGSPPCPEFSIGGRGDGRKHTAELIDAVVHMDYARRIPGASDEVHLVLEPLRWIYKRIVAGDPFDTVVLEQVPPVLPVWQAYALALTENGYRAAAGIVDAYDFGVGQTRERAVLIASREPEVHPRLPVGAEARIGFAETLGLRGDWTLVSNYTSGVHRKHRSVRHSPEPSFTLTGHCTRMKLVMGHIDPPRSTAGLGRSLTVPESGLLQGFHIDYPWQGTKTEQALQIGNAVPPPLTRALIAAARGIE